MKMIYINQLIAHKLLIYFPKFTYKNLNIDKMTQSSIKLKFNTEIFNYQNQKKYSAIWNLTINPRVQQTI